MSFHSLLLALACHSDSKVIALDTAVGSDNVDTAATTDTAGEADASAPPDPAPFEESTGAQDTAELDAWIFDDMAIHTIDIDIDGSAIAAVEADPDTPVRASMRFDGIRVPDIGVKLRGKIGSFRRFSGKPKFELDVNTFAPGRTFYGLKELLLNNEVVDCGYLKEPLAYATFAALGLPALRTSWASVRVNGAEYGLYVLLESPDDRFLARTFPDASGNLYDGKYIYDRATGGYTLLDFASGQDRLFQLEEGDDIDWADVREISSRMGLTRGTPDFYAQVGHVVDMPAFHAHLAAEQLVGHNDGYALNQNNYRFYFDPARDGRMVFVAWDFDYGYLEDAWWGMSWMNPRARLAAQCWADATCRAAQRDAVDAATTALDTAALRAKLDAWDTLTRDLAAADPRRECGAWDIAPSRDYLRTWLDTRSGAVRALWGLP